MATDETQPGNPSRVEHHDGYTLSADRPPIVPVAVASTEPALPPPSTPPPACRAEYTPPGGRQRGDRIVPCDLPRGHDGEHEETDTEVQWASPVRCDFLILGHRCQHLAGHTGTHNVTFSVPATDAPTRSPFPQWNADLDQLIRERDDARAERDRFREHSITLNRIAFAMATALGRVPEGADAVMGDPDEQLAALVAQRDSAWASHQATAEDYNTACDERNALRERTETAERERNEAVRVYTTMREARDRWQAAAQRERARIEAHAEPHRALVRERERLDATLARVRALADLWAARTPYWTIEFADASTELFNALSATETPAATRPTAEPGTAGSVELAGGNEPVSREHPTDPRPFGDLRSTGLLWLINAAVFHPRGFALALCYDGGQLAGWRLLGDGSEPWRFEGDLIDRHFADVEALFAAHRPTTEPGTAGSVDAGPVSAADIEAVRRATGVGIRSTNLDVPLADDEPRAWRLPDEPGPEVTAVRAKAGRLYRRAYDGWRGDGLAQLVDWHELLRYAPLTDATAEVAARDRRAERHATHSKPQVHDGTGVPCVCCGLTKHGMFCCGLPVCDECLKTCHDCDDAATREVPDGD